MDEISDEQKLEWLTTAVPTRTRAMVNTGDFEDDWQVPKYRITRLRRRIDRPAFGNLGKLPLELLCIVFRHLTCDDLEALHSCSTGGRIAVLAFPQYHTLLTHIPTILAILKVTRLARSFTVTHIYETFTALLCTSCGQFGGYVFLPSFTRCCLHCAETAFKFLPISREVARNEFGVTGKKMMASLPQLNNIEGYRELVERLRNPNHTPGFPGQRQRYAREKSVQAYQRYMALTPLPSFIPKSASMEEGVYCAGCEIRFKEHSALCLGADYSDWRSYERTAHRITDGADTCCSIRASDNQCSVVADRDRLHDSRHVLTHLQACVAAQALLKVKWTRSQKNV